MAALAGFGPVGDAEAAGRPAVAESVFDRTGAGWMGANHDRSFQLLFAWSIRVGSRRPLPSAPDPLSPWFGARPLAGERDLDTPAIEGDPDATPMLVRVGVRPLGHVRPPCYPISLCSDIVPDRHRAECRHPSPNVPWASANRRTFRQSPFAAFRRGLPATTPPSVSVLAPSSHLPTPVGARPTGPSMLHRRAACGPTPCRRQEWGGR